MKIQSITLENYRFFQNSETFEIDGNNVLLYGENGSGKSSLFYALQKLFRYYRDPDNAKENIKDAQNIFVDSATEKPKITIKIGDKTITFDENGLDDDSLQVPIENTGKSKLFLTYKDVYAINAIFQENLTYKEFKNIFTTLFYDELESPFKSLESMVNSISDYLYQDYFREDIASLSDSHIEFEFDDSDFVPVEKDDGEGGKLKNIFESVNVVSSGQIQRLQALIDSLDTSSEFLREFCSETDIKRDVIKHLIQIMDQISDYSYENRYEQRVDSGEIIIGEVNEIDVLDSLFEDGGQIEGLLSGISEVESLCEKINTTIHDKLNTLKDKYINKILKYLQSNLELSVIPKIRYLAFDKKFLRSYTINRSLEFEILYAGKKLDNHSQNLNEAKMSALNTAIYFAAVMDKKPNIRILVLDDLMISLDMSNRAKMLEFLLDKSNFDETYQMMIFTHDRAFFETARRITEKVENGRWKYIEMYENSSSDTPKPLIMPSENHLEKAEAYFKIGDYPAAGNYLRKASEVILKGKLFETFLKEVEDSTLAPIIQKYKEMCTVFGISIPKSIMCLEELTKRVFNPSSHDDLVSPLYKKEINDAIRLVHIITRLPKIEKHTTTIKQGSLLTFKYDGKYEAVYRFLGDVSVYTYGDQILNRDTILLSKCGHKLLVEENWIEDNQRDSKCLSLKKIFERNRHFIHKQNLSTIEIDIETFIENIGIDGFIWNSEMKKLILKQIS